MKNPKYIRYPGMALLAGAALVTSMTLGSARAGEVVINNFDNADELNGWAWESWSDPASVEFDPTLDAGGSTADSGSMKVINNFPYRPDGYSQCVVTLPLGSDIDAETLYTKISLDVKVDPSSSLRTNGVSYGGLEVIFRNGSDWAWNSLGYVALTSTNWVHLEYPVKAPGDKEHHLTLKLGENNLTNTVIYNVDNIRWTESTVQIPPPTMSMEKARPGLNLTAGTSGQYDRQNIKCLTQGLGWIGSSSPMSYSVTIKDFPDGTAYSGFQSQMYLVPGSPGTESSPDWTEPTVVYVTIQSGTNGNGTLTFHYKTDDPNSNGHYFNTDPAAGQVGNLGSVTGARVSGTWTVTFAQDTQITLKAPDGTSTNLVMPAVDAAKFAGEIAVYYGVQPNETKNIGQTVILSGAKVTSGSTVLVEDSFNTVPLNPDVWATNASSAACVAMVGAKDPVWVWWTTPASGFILQTNSAANPDSWGTPDPVLPDALIGLKRRALIPESAVPSTTQGFFRLIKQ